jgi:hypothetical protein
MQSQRGHDPCKEIVSPDLGRVTNSQWTCNAKPAGTHSRPAVSPPGFGDEHDPEHVGIGDRDNRPVPTYGLALATGWTPACDTRRSTSASLPRYYTRRSSTCGMDTVVGLVAAVAAAARSPQPMGPPAHPAGRTARIIIGIADGDPVI